MGASVGAVAFQLDTDQYNLSKIVTDLFGNDFAITHEYCDSGKHDCIYIGKTKDFVVIVSTDFTNQFFASTNTSVIDRYLRYFSNPEFVFAFEEYDSGGTYSYSLIYKGQVKRQLRSISYNREIDFGEPEPKELKWLQAETKTEDDGDGGVITYYTYKDRDRNFTCTANELPRVMLQELMLEKLGFTTWNMDDLFLEKRRYKKQFIPQTMPYEAPATTGYNKPWWKFW